MTITKQALENLYWNQELSIRAIASLLEMAAGDSRVHRGGIA
jgi:hypothetical protein